MPRQVTLDALLSCAEALRLAYRPLKRAALNMDRADALLCPDFRIAPIVEVRQTLWDQLGVLDVEIGWIEGEIAKRQKEG
ncbi:unnamed protein product [marine sediment metagenome]|uniref:Uncharacterized protein n=1 Tax=marine sediment metagenome TaxID=412755 RepID=X1TFV9_9ZZZZ